MEISVQENTFGINVIKLSGRLEAFTVVGLREKQEELLTNGAANFVVDLSDLTFMDSAGLSALVSLLKRARQNGGDVALVAPSDADAYRILTLTRFDKVFKITDTTDEALKSF